MVDHYKAYDSNEHTRSKDRRPSAQMYQNQIKEEKDSRSSNLINYFIERLSPEQR